MALVLITNPPSTLVVSSNWTDFVAREDISNIGTGLSIPIFTLTNWDGTTTKPEIASGSIIEVGGSLYQADSNTALTDEGGLTNGTVHIKLVPTGGGATVVPTLTNDSIPAWDAVKGGWYDSDDKFLPFEMTKASAVYTVKSEFIDHNKLITRFTDGALKLSGALTVATGISMSGALSGVTTAAITTGNITTGNITTNNVTTQNMTGTMKWKYYEKISGGTTGVWFTTLATWVPTIGDFMKVEGQFHDNPFEGVIHWIVRISSTIIHLKYSQPTTEAITTEAIVSGGGTTAFNIEIMSNFDALT